MRFLWFPWWVSFHVGATYNCFSWRWKYVSCLFLNLSESLLLPWDFRASLRPSVQFSRSVVSNFWRPLGLQHVRLPYPSPSPRACSNSCPSSRWCHPTISSFVVPFSSCPQSFPASWSFPMSQFFVSGGQSIGASASVLPMNIQDWFPLGWTGLISCSPRDSQESSPTPQFKRM